MAKRKMPPHIVLPNGQWRFVKRGHSAKTRGGYVARRGHRVSHRRGSRGLGGGFLMKGVAGKYLPAGLIGLGLGVVGGWAWGTYVSPMIPKLLPYQKQIETGVLLGLPGAAGSLASGPASSTSQGGVYF